MTNSNSIQKARQLRKELALTMSDGYIASKGGWLKVFITQSSVIQNIYYGLRVDLLIHKFGSHWNKWINEELSKNLTKEELNNKGLVDNIKKDINNCYKQIKSNPFDYFFFDLRNKTKEERAKFATDIWILSTLSRKRGLRKMHDIELNEKYNFYKLTKEYFKREVIPVTATNYQEFEQYTLRHKRVIAKSTYEACGKSIYIFEVNSKEDAKKEYDRIISYGGSYILEELIIQHPEMAKWNESSVNTVRVITIHNSTEANVLLAFMRAGRKGSAVDNGGTGGIFATIDINTGKISSNGVDEHNNRYTQHPDSKMEYIGWSIPQWNEVLELAKEIHSNIFPENPFIGWDFALTKNGWVLVEGNWSQFVCQAAAGIGVKDRLLELMKK